MTETSSKSVCRNLTRIPKPLRVFGWNLWSGRTRFEQNSLALNTIELGRAWHWRLIPCGWMDTAFVLRHGQIKTKRAFAAFFPNLKDPESVYTKRVMKLRSAEAGDKPLDWTIVKVTQLGDLLDAKISALSTRGFLRDFLDLFMVDEQRDLDWKTLLIRASKNFLNDYNPIELENNLRLIDQELRTARPELPCSRPPALAALLEFAGQLRSLNAEVARELAQAEPRGDDPAEEE